MISTELQSRINLELGIIERAPLTLRRLRDLEGCFADEQAFSAALAIDNPVVYSVSSVEPADGDGDMHYGLGMIMPGKVGDEYYLTKGHLHSWRAAAEVYVGLRGDGRMLLENEVTGETRLEILSANTIVYVPGHTAHRTINCGDEPLLYLGIYPAAAGHDYEPIATRNFSSILIDKNSVPTILKREEL